MHTPRIAVVGAGPGGLMLARILHLHNWPVQVFERESFSTARHQGGSLDMHADSGQYALQCAGLSNEFRTLPDNVSGKDRPEVDRGHLRQTLLDSLPVDSIRLGAGV